MKKKLLPIVGYSFIALALVFFIIVAAGLVWTMVETYSQAETCHKNFASGRAWFAVKLSALSATVSTVLAMIFAIPSGYILSRRNFFGKKIIEALLLAPIVISPVATGALLLIFFGTLPGQIIERIFGGIVFETRGILAAQFVMVSGLATTMAKTVFDYTGLEYEETARTLGADETDAFLRVTFPLALRGLISSAILVWARALGEFGATVTLAGATSYKTETLPVAIYLALASTDIYLTGLLVILSFAMAMGILFILKTALDK